MTQGYSRSQWGALSIQDRIRAMNAALDIVEKTPVPKLDLTAEYSASEDDVTVPDSAVPTAQNLFPERSTVIDIWRQRESSSPKSSFRAPAQPFQVVSPPAGLEQPLETPRPSSKYMKHPQPHSESPTMMADEKKEDEDTNVHVQPQWAREMWSKRAAITSGKHGFRSHSEIPAVTTTRPQSKAAAPKLAERLADLTIMPAKEGEPVLEPKRSRVTEIWAKQSLQNITDEPPPPRTTRDLGEPSKVAMAAVAAAQAELGDCALEPVTPRGRNVVAIWQNRAARSDVQSDTIAPLPKADLLKTSPLNPPTVAATQKFQNVGSKIFDQSHWNPSGGVGASTVLTAMTGSSPSKVVGRSSQTAAIGTAVASDPGLPSRAVVAPLSERRLAAASSSTTPSRRLISSERSSEATLPTNGVEDGLKPVRGAVADRWNLAVKVSQLGGVSDIANSVPGSVQRPNEGSQKFKVGAGSGTKSKFLDVHEGTALQTGLKSTTTDAADEGIKNIPKPRDAGPRVDQPKVLEKTFSEAKTSWTGTVKVKEEPFVSRDAYSVPRPAVERFPLQLWNATGAAEAGELWGMNENELAQFSEGRLEDAQRDIDQRSEIAGPSKIVNSSYQSPSSTIKPSFTVDNSEHVGSSRPASWTESESAHSFNPLVPLLSSKSSAFDAWTSGSFPAEWSARDAPNDVEIFGEVVSSPGANEGRRISSGTGRDSVATDIASVFNESADATAPRLGAASLASLNDHKGASQYVVLEHSEGEAPDSLGVHREFVRAANPPSRFSNHRKHLPSPMIRKNRPSNIKAISCDIEEKASEDTSGSYGPRPPRELSQHKKKIWAQRHKTKPVLDAEAERVAFKDDKQVPSPIQTSSSGEMSEYIQFLPPSLQTALLDSPANITGNHDKPRFLFPSEASDVNLSVISDSGTLHSNVSGHISLLSSGSTTLTNRAEKALQQKRRTQRLAKRDDGDPTLHEFSSKQTPPIPPPKVTGAKVPSGWASSGMEVGLQDGHDREMAGLSTRYTTASRFAEPKNVKKRALQPSNPSTSISKQSSKEPSLATLSESSMRTGDTASTESDSQYHTERRKKQELKNKSKSKLKPRARARVRYGSKTGIVPSEQFLNENATNLEAFESACKTFGLLEMASDWAGELKLVGWESIAKEVNERASCVKERAKACSDLNPFDEDIAIEVEILDEESNSVQDDEGTMRHRDLTLCTNTEDFESLTATDLTGVDTYDYYQEEVATIKLADRRRQ